jgi:hypothetical protein
MNVTDAYVPEHLFGMDHFTTLAYAETVMVDCAGFQVGSDPRMRSCRRHFRVMQEQCPRPRRVKGGIGVVMLPEHGSRLADGSLVSGHDDWHCIQDMAEAGYFVIKDALGGPPVVATAEVIEPGAVLLLSARGREVVNALRGHKASGGTFASFVPPAAVPEITASKESRDAHHPCR